MSLVQSTCRSCSPTCFANISVASITVSAPRARCPDGNPSPDKRRVGDRRNRWRQRHLAGATSDNINDVGPVERAGVPSQGRDRKAVIIRQPTQCAAHPGVRSQCSVGLRLAVQGDGVRQRPVARAHRQRVDDVTGVDVDDPDRGSRSGIDAKVAIITKCCPDYRAFVNGESRKQPGGRTFMDPLSGAPFWSARFRISACSPCWRSPDASAGG